MKSRLEFIKKELSKFKFNKKILTIGIALFVFVLGITIKSVIDNPSANDTVEVKFYYNGPSENNVVSCYYGQSSSDLAVCSYRQDRKFEELPTAKRDGYTLIGWFTEPEGGEQLTEDREVSSIIGSDDVSFYAHWGYTITLNANGGHVDNAKDVGYIYNSEKDLYEKVYDLNSGSRNPSNEIKDDLENLIVSKDNVILDGWFYKNTKITNDSELPVEDATFIAQYTEGYKIKYDPNGGTGTMEDTSCRFGYGCNISSNTFENTGFTFKEWNDREDGSGTAYTDKMLIDSNSGLLQDDLSVILYAQWAGESKRNIMYNGNGGTVICLVGTEASETCSRQESDTLKTFPIISDRIGYYFTGWYTEQKDGKKIELDTKISDIGTDTLYAHWSKGVNITFNANGGTLTCLLSTEPATSCSKTYNPTMGELNNTDLPYSSSPIRDGYTWTGWCASRICTTEESSTKILFPKQDTIYYAHWLKDINVTFDGNSGEVSCDNTNFSSSCFINTVETNESALPTAKRDGYTLDGWYTSAEGGEKITDSNISSASGKTLYAHWVATSSVTKVNVTFNGNGGVMMCPNNFQPTCTGTFTPGEKISLPRGIYWPNSNYIFEGWYTKVSGGEKITSESIVPADAIDITYYAHWTNNSSSDIDPDKSYTVKYNANDGTGTMNDTICEYGKDCKLSTNTFIKEGYTFKEWNDKADGTGTSYKDKSTIEFADSTLLGSAAASNIITLYAQWTKNSSSDIDPDKSYAVKYNANSGTGTMNDTICEFGKDCKLSTNTFTKEGYTFKEWNDKADGTGASYKDSSTIEFADSTLLGSAAASNIITLYAQWTKNSSGSGDTPPITKYTVTFNSNGGSKVSAQIVEKGSKITKPTNPTKSNDEFIGWYKESSLTTEWNFDSDIVEKDVTLYAKWKSSSSTIPTDPADIKYTVTFSDNGNVISSQQVKTGSKITKPTNPEKDGYKFDGWYKESSLTTKWDFTKDVVTSDITLYAKWIKNSSSGDKDNNSTNNDNNQNSTNNGNGQNSSNNEGSSVNNDSSIFNNPQTGDINLSLLIGGIIISGALLIITIVYIIKNKKNKI